MTYCRFYEGFKTYYFRATSSFGLEKDLQITFDGQRIQF